MDLLNLSTTEKSKAGAKMVICWPDTEVPFTHARLNAKGKEVKDDEGAVIEDEMFLLLLGPESPEMMRAVSQSQQRAKKRKEKHTPSEEEATASIWKDCKMLASLTAGGRVYLSLEDGAEPTWFDVTKENAASIYQRVTPVRIQAMDFVFKPGNYTKA